MQTVRVGELVHETRLAYTGLGNERHDLAMTVGGELLDAAELLKFGIATDEPRQPASGARLEAGARRPRPRQFVTSTASESPFTGTGPSGFTATKPSTISSVDRVRRMVPGLASCSMRDARWVVRPIAV